VRVIVTTNFDRLIEASLDDLGVRWSRVTNEAEIETAQPREVAQVFILKLHGDYGSIDMRNTTDEISILAPGVADELRSILRTHGLVIVGYAGSDEAVAATLRSIRPRLGLYWAVRGQASEVQSEILSAVAGWTVPIESADAFAADLERRVESLTASPSSHLPLDVYRETVSLIRRGDLIGVREEIKQHGAASLDWFAEWRDRITAANLDWGFSRNRKLEEWRPRIDRFANELGPIIEDLLGVGLALVEYRREDLSPLLQWMDRLQAESQTRGGYAPPISGSCADIACACVLQMMAGALAVRAWPSLEILMSWPDVANRAPTLGLSPNFHHYAFFETDATWLPHAHQLLLDRSEVWKEGTRDRANALMYVIWVGVLLAVQAEARAVPSQPPAIWSFFWNHYTRRVEDLARLIGRDDSLADSLGRAADETGGCLSEQFR
jgi:hypothetical protein